LGGLSIQDIKPEWRRLLSPLCLAESQDRNWISTRHHKIIDYEFRKLISPGNPTDILIITCPPRMGKSTYLSHWAPAHYLLRHPTQRVMLCSYGMRLAKFLSRRVRDRVHQCAPLFGVKGVNPMVSAADDWEIDGDGGGMMASGVEGSITGRGANLLLIDDYLRKGKDAASNTVRENQWEWFQSTSSTRREPGAKICLIGTPWHSDDLIGRIMSQRDGLGLSVRRVAFQAIRVNDGTPDPLGRAEGESIWPDRWPVEVLDKQRRLMGPYWWQAQYQGVPGQYGKNEWPASYFSNIWAQEDEWPDRVLMSAVALDPSKGAHEDSGDYQSMCYAGFHAGKIWLDFDVDRRPVPQMMRDFARFCYDRRPGIVGIEANAFQDLLAPDYIKACQDIGYNVTAPELILNTVNKMVRIMRLATYLDAHAIKVKRNAGGEEFVRQAKAFPNGDFDDALDSCEMSIRLLNYYSTGQWNEDEADILVT
jgi:predicted phage terminase large subunit-like protein